MQPIKLFENFLLLFKWNALTWQVLYSSENQVLHYTHDVKLFLLFES
jgi:hypothetical protein